MFQVRNASANPPFLSERPAKRRRNLEDTMISFMKTPIPNVPAPKPNDDRSFFQSLIAIVSTFNVEQKLDFRSGVLDFAKKIRLSVIHTATHTQHNVPQEQHFPSQNQPRVPWQYPLSVQCSPAMSNISTSAHSLEDSTESVDLFQFPQT